jgi:hypothetical protein
MGLESAEGETTPGSEISDRERLSSSRRLGRSSQ